MNGQALLQCSPITAIQKRPGRRIRDSEKRHTSASGMALTAMGVGRRECGAVRLCMASGARALLDRSVVGVRVSGVPPITYPSIMDYLFWYSGLQGITLPDVFSNTPHE